MVYALLGAALAMDLEANAGVETRVGVEDELGAHGVATVDGAAQLTTPHAVVRLDGSAGSWWVDGGPEADLEGVVAGRVHKSVGPLVVDVTGHAFRDGNLRWGLLHDPARLEERGATGTAGLSVPGTWTVSGYGGASTLQGFDGTRGAPMGWQHALLAGGRAGWSDEHWFVGVRSEGRWAEMELAPWVAAGHPKHVYSNRNQLGFERSGPRLDLFLWLGVSRANPLFMATGATGVRVRMGDSFVQLGLHRDVEPDWRVSYVRVEGAFDRQVRVRTDRGFLMDVHTYRGVVSLPTGGSHEMALRSSVELALGGDIGGVRIQGFAGQDVQGAMGFRFDGVPANFRRHTAGLRVSVGDEVAPTWSSPTPWRRG